MNTVRAKVFAAAALLSAAGLVSGVARAVDDATLKDISRYSEWGRVAELTVPLELAAAGG